MKKKTDILTAERALIAPRPLDSRRKHPFSSAGVKGVGGLYKGAGAFWLSVLSRAGRGDIERIGIWGGWSFSFTFLRVGFGECWRDKFYMFVDTLEESLKIRWIETFTLKYDLKNLIKKHSVFWKVTMKIDRKWTFSNILFLDLDYCVVLYWLQKNRRTCF